MPDKRYDRLNFPIHEYFVAKMLDQVRPGGVIAVVTSSYTMDKRTASARKYIAQRSELLGAIRLPNNAFKAAAGTEVVSDILFLQKRERMVDIEPEWVHLATNEDGIQMNSYFIDHPDMILGEMKMVSGPSAPRPPASHTRSSRWKCCWRRPFRTSTARSPPMTGRRNWRVRIIPLKPIPLSATSPIRW